MACLFYLYKNRTHFCSVPGCKNLTNALGSELVDIWLGFCFTCIFGCQSLVHNVTFRIF